MNRRTDAALAIDLRGYGRVGRALDQRLPTRGISIMSIRTRRGVRLWRPYRGEPPVLVDATSPAYRGPASVGWIRQLESVLRSGIPIVTCNKAPLAIGWARLLAAAAVGGSTISCSGTVGGGTPILPALACLARAGRVLRMEAELNATSAFVASEVARGRTIGTAVVRAQRLGWAEPDPSLDLDGTDTRAKAVILHNVVFGGRRAPLDLRSVAAPAPIEERRIRALSRGGRRPRLIADIRPGRVRVRWAARSPDSTPLGSARVLATLEDGETVLVRGPGAGPEATAGALLADLDRVGEVGGGAPPGVLL